MGAEQHSGDFATVLRRFRRGAGLSQEALAERAGISAKAVSALERGARRAPYRATVEALCDALDLAHAERDVLIGAATHKRPLRREAGPARTNLPPQLTSHLGRAAEMAELAQLIATHRLVTVTGAGGIGKTRMALALGATLRNAYRDGVWFVEFAPLASGTYLPSTVAQAVGIKLGAPEDPLAALVTALATHHALLILDNCEHLVDAAGRTVAALLRGCPELRMVVTTRQRLGVAGEVAYRLPSLGVPRAGETLRIEDARSHAAVELFVERAIAIDRRFALTAANAPIVGDICRRLDGIPLAIELAAARIDVLGPLQLRDRLDERFAVLTSGHRDVLPRHQTLRALIDWSYDHLSAPERALFRRLSAFARGWTLEGAVAVGEGSDATSAAVFDLLASLIDKSLAIAESGGDDSRRYRMLESTRAYAREKLVEAGELAAATDRHRRHLCERFAAARTRVARTGSSADMDALLESELDEVRVVLEDDASGNDAARLLAAIADRWQWIGLGAEGLGRLERAIARLPRDEVALASQLASAIARVAAGINRVRARAATEHAVGTARLAHDAEALASALTIYGETLTADGSFAAAAAALAEAEAHAPAANVWLSLRVLDARTLLACSSGDFDGAVRGYEQLRATQLRLRNLSEATNAAINLAEIEHERGNTERAVASMESVLPALRARRDRSSLFLALGNLCGYLVALDRCAETRRVAREALATCDDADLEGPSAATVIEHLALARAIENDVAESAVLAGYADGALRRAGFAREFTEQASRTRLEAFFARTLPAPDAAALFAEGERLGARDAQARALRACRASEEARSAHTRRISSFRRRD